MKNFSYSGETLVCLTMSSSSSLLLKGGIVVVHDTNDHASGIKADLLVRGNRIVEIAPNIMAGVGVEVINCQNKIIAPGFVDTHRHMYNTPLRGRYADSLITDYIVTGKSDMMSWGPRKHSRRVLTLTISNPCPPDRVFRYPSKLKF